MIGAELHRIEELLPDGAATLRVPVMGPSLCAGFPSPANDFVENALELPRWLVPNPPATFLWRIAGDSMRDAGIFDGDLVCVDRSLKPAHGSVVEAVDGEMLIKCIVVKGNRARLAFDNTDLTTAIKRRDNLLDLVEEGDEAAKARFRAVAKTVSDLMRRLDRISTSQRRCRRMLSN